MKIYCNTCKNETEHRVLATRKRNFSPSYNPETMAPGSRCLYQILSCNGCNEDVVFREFIEPYGHDDVWDTIENFYPDREENLKEEKSYRQAPPLIKSLYRQTINAFNIQAFHLCAGGLRALIEAVCLKKSVKGGNVLDRKSKNLKYRDNLQGKIEGLVQKGILAPPDAKILHKHRYLGNVALHKLKEPTKDSLESAIEVIEHLLERLYVIPFTAKNIKPGK